MNSGRPDALPRTSILRAPAVQALLIQLVAFALTIALGYVASSLMAVNPTIAIAALSQGLIAAAITRFCKLASWWMLIQAALPIGLVTTLSLQIPPVYFLVAFLVMVFLFWSTYRTQVPFYPSRLPAWRAVAELLPQDRSIRFIDIGSGFGGLVMHLADARREGNFVGIEIAPLPWFVSALLGLARRSNANFVRGDYTTIDFAFYDVVFAYLSPAAMATLWKKASTEMRAGSLLLSYEFDIPGVEPDVVSVPDEGGPTLYGWYV
jgi:hypothetical protein